MAGPVPELEDRAAACAERLHEADRVLLASHIDADGLTSAAVASSALERASVPFEVVFEKQLDEDAIARIARTDYETVWFTDFGSGQLDVITDYAADGGFTPVIADHHQPADADTEFHCNPLLEGLDGASELSGAGTTYLLARELAGDCVVRSPKGENHDEASGERRERESGPNPPTDPTMTDGGTVATTARADNRDLAALAVVGAVGDMQASSGELHGANAEIVADGVEAGVLEPTTDLALYGTQTRPLPKLLEYATDVRIPGISNDQRGAMRFLDGLDLELRDDAGEWRRWGDLTTAEQQTVASALVKHAISRGVPASKIDGLVGTSYQLTAEPAGTELRDASEFSTLLNATARYDRADVGLAVCLGDRGGALERARELLRSHRRNLSEGIDLVTTEGVTNEGHVQWFHAGDRIRETIVGIVAGMALGNEGIDRDRPILAFAAKSDEPDAVKVSGRGTHALVRQGLDLSVVLGEAARHVGGDGGGHDVAAGATVPAGREPDFLKRADDLVGEQLGQ
ncbi:phosphoesterase RecJ domain-containing protein [Halovivax asiaticus JCM 14624]|uniref:Phosphoesterase RecJ domain-containing protein n=1 Tax=Halovivax asiaticus JCM 14624 TaxID=1227490 RepID=M0BKL6_9EURY|nr:DHH family phosphoesterase [Halovivax asiaticus]ELZ10853.1 phosphoesterase RecJ domain-containing protein [Halovivax asiaticus JCM 14624]